MANKSNFVKKIAGEISSGMSKKIDDIPMSSSSTANFLSPVSVAKKLYQDYNNVRSDVTNYLGDKIAQATDITDGASYGQAGRDAVAGLASTGLDIITPDVMDVIPIGKVASTAMRMAEKVPQIKRVSDVVSRAGGALGMTTKGANLEGKAVFGSKPTNFGSVTTPDMPKQGAFTQEMRDAVDKMMIKHKDTKLNDPAQYQALKQSTTDFVRNNWDTLKPKK